MGGGGVGGYFFCRRLVPEDCLAAITEHLAEVEFPPFADGASELLDRKSHLMFSI